MKAVTLRLMQHAAKSEAFIPSEDTFSLRVIRQRDQRAQEENADGSASGLLAARLRIPSPVLGPPVGSTRCKVHERPRVMRQKSRAPNCEYGKYEGLVLRAHRHTVQAYNKIQLYLLTRT